MPATQALADFICATPTTVLAAGRAVAETSLLDTLCAQYAGADADATGVVGRVLERYVFRSAGEGSHDAASYRAFNGGVSAAAAGLDDCAKYGAAGAVVWPALLATLPEGAAVDANALLDSFWLGILAAEALWAAGRYREADRGFDGTVVFGTVASTAAILRHHECDAALAVAALSISTSLIGGLIVNLGSDMDAVHPGIAAMNGVRGVALAGNGLRGAPDIFEARQGFVEAFFGAGCCSTEDLKESMATVSDRSPSLRFRRIPGHIDNQDIVTALSRAMSDGSLDYEDVISLEIDGVAPTSGGVRFDLPATQSQERASLHHMAAMGLLSGGRKLDLGHGYPLPEGKKAEAMAKVRVGVMSRWDPRLAEATPPSLRGTVTLTGGRQIDIAVDPASTASADVVTEKWDRVRDAVARAGRIDDSLAIKKLLDVWRSNPAGGRVAKLLAHRATKLVRQSAR
jgi:2-methylcitrate dehydratase PrpD